MATLSFSEWFDKSAFRGVEQRRASQAAWNVASKINVEKNTPTNTASLKSAPEIVESDSLCDYCQYGHNEDPGVCGACDDYNCFRGRRLQA